MSNNNIAKFSQQVQTVYHYGEVKQLPEKTVFQTTADAMVCEKVNPVKGAKEQYTFAKAYFVFAGKRQVETVCLPVSTLVSLPDADSSKKATGPKLTLGQILGEKA